MLGKGAEIQRALDEEVQGAPARGTLPTNMSPLFRYADYMEKLIDVYRATTHKFSHARERPNHQASPEREMFHLYGAAPAFNNPVTNAPLPADRFAVVVLDGRFHTDDLAPVPTRWGAPPP